MSAFESNALEPQPRDFALLRGLFECRVMTADHIATLYFGGKSEYTKKRLQKLKAAGLISERPRRMNEPAVLCLTRKGSTFSIVMASFRNTRRSQWRPPTPDF